MAGAFDQNTPRQGAAKELAKPEQTIAMGSPTTVLSVRFMILQQLAETNQPTYSHTISGNLAQYGITKERILIELNKLANSTSKPVKRNKSPFNKRYLYLITENGVNELKKRKNTILHSNTLTVESPPLDPYLWLLENLTEARTIEELVELRGDSEVTLRVYLSQLYKLGAIDKRKEPEEKQISQRNRNGDIINRTTTVFRTYYCMKNGPLKDKWAETPGFEALGEPVKTFKMEVPIPNTAVKDPVFTTQEEEEYQKWREGIRDIGEFNAAILKKANKTGIRPATAYRLVFRQLKDSGRI